MNRSFLVLALAFTACDGGDKSDSGVEGACDVTVTSFPASGAVDAYYRGNIEFRLTGADDTATIETDIPGAQAVSADGLTVYWVPSAALTPGGSYSATLHYCGGDATISFTTSMLGTPSPTTASWPARPTCSTCRTPASPSPRASARSSPASSAASASSWA